MNLKAIPSTMYWLNQILSLHLSFTGIFDQIFLILDLGVYHRFLYCIIIGWSLILIFFFRALSYLKQYVNLT